LSYKKKTIQTARLNRMDRYYLTHRTNYRLVFDGLDVDINGEIKWN
jgi:hypothetical protein